MASKKNNEQQAPDLNLSDDQQRVAEALVFSGVSFERERLTKVLSPHRDKAISVDTMIDIINNVPPKQEEASEEEV